MASPEDVAGEELEVAQMQRCKHSWLLLGVVVVVN
jgi:hypothetical protein